MTEHDPRLEPEDRDLEKYIGPDEPTEIPDDLKPYRDTDRP